MGSKMKGSLGVGGFLGGSLSSLFRGVGIAGGVWPVCLGGVGGYHGDAGVTMVVMKSDCLGV